jgi:hypothetical protein
MRPTSAAAMIKAAPRFSSNKAKVYHYLADQGIRGATDQEMQATLMMSGDTLRPARLSLLKDDLIYDSGQTRQNPNGNDCIVWVISDIQQIGMF